MGVRGVGEAQPLEKNLEQSRHLGTGRTADQVEFVEHEVEARVLAAHQPIACLRQDGVVDFANEHCVEDRLVCDEDVRRCRLHVPPGNQFGAVGRREDVAQVGIAVGGQTLLDRLVALQFLLQLAAGAGVARLPCLVLALARMLQEPRYRRLARISSEEDAVPVEVPGHHILRVIGVQRLAQAHHLVFDEGV
ncbi:hypothetical protein D3C71_301510 [compost metagenome]